MATGGSDCGGEHTSSSGEEWFEAEERPVTEQQLQLVNEQQLQPVAQHGVPPLSEEERQRIAQEIANFDRLAPLVFPGEYPPNPWPTRENPYLWPQRRHVTCGKCGMRGHYGRDCPWGRPICFNCYVPGHIRAHCQLPEIRPQGRFFCHICREDGHQPRNCPRGRPPTCFRCNSGDHFARNCLVGTATALQSAAARLSQMASGLQAMASGTSASHRTSSRHPTSSRHRTSSRHHRSQNAITDGQLAASSTASQQSNRGASNRDRSHRDARATSPINFEASTSGLQRDTSSVRSRSNLSSSSSSGWSTDEEDVFRRPPLSRRRSLPRSALSRGPPTQRLRIQSSQEPEPPVQLALDEDWDAEIAAIAATELTQSGPQPAAQPDEQPDEQPDAQPDLQALPQPEPEEPIVIDDEEEVIVLGDEPAAVVVDDGPIAEYAADHEGEEEFEPPWPWQVGPPPPHHGMAIIPPDVFAPIDLDNWGPQPAEPAIAPLPPMEIRQSTLNFILAQEQSPEYADNTPTTNDTCKVCLNRDRQILFLPCSHYITCRLCAFTCLMNDAFKCPLCRGRVYGALKPVG